MYLVETINISEINPYCTLGFTTNFKHDYFQDRFPKTKILSLFQAVINNIKETEHIPELIKINCQWDTISPHIYLIAFRWLTPHRSQYYLLYEIPVMEIIEYDNLSYLVTLISRELESQFYAIRQVSNSQTPIRYDPVLDIPKIIGDASCIYNARSNKIRCAVNPSGQCQGCQHYKSIS